MRAKSELRKEYSTELHQYYLDLKAKQRAGMPLGFSNTEIDKFLDELRTLTNQVAHPSYKRAA